MKLRRVDPKSIMIPEVRVTARFDEEKWQQFQQSMKSIGQVAPIICVEDEEQLVLVDGLHRLQEAIANKARVIEVAVIPGNKVTAITRNIFLDHLRGKTPVSEMRKVIEFLYKEEKMTIEDMVKETGLSQGYIENLLLISELTPMCLEALDQERIGVGHASALVRVKDPDRQEMVLNQLLTYHWSVKQLNEYISSVLAIVEERAAAPIATEPQPTPKVKCRYCGGDFDPFQVASVITCQSCSGIMYEAVAMARREAQQGQVPEDNTK